MIPQQYTGGTPGAGGISGPGFAGQPAPAEAKPSIWSDPNLLSIMLGTMGSAVMGEHQQSWQAQMGRGAAGLGRSFKMADVVARRAAEKKAETERMWEGLTRAISGLSKPSEKGIMSIRGLSGEGSSEIPFG